MIFAYALYDLAAGVHGVGAEIVSLGSKIMGIYLIGQWLSIPFFQIGGRVMLASTRIADAANRFENVYDEIKQGVVLPYAIQELINWKSEIINFIINKRNYILDTVRPLLNGFDAFTSNPYNYLLSHVLAIIYNNFSFLRDVSAKITEIINSLIPNFSTLRYNPIQWVIDKIRAYSGALSRFISDPDGYIKERLYIFFPNLKLFFDDPASYIIEKLSEKIEIFAERNLTRLIKIVENAINNIF